MAAHAQMGPFAIVPRWVLRSTLSDSAVRLYAALADRADRETDVATFSRKTLAADVGLKDVGTISRRLKELEAFGAIRIEYVSDAAGQQVSRYTVIQVDPRGENASGGVAKTPGGGGENAKGPLAETPGPPIAKSPRVEEPALQEPSTRTEFLSPAADAAGASNGDGQPALFDIGPSPAQPAGEPETGKHPFTVMVAAMEAHLTDASSYKQIGQAARDLLEFGYEPDQLPTLASVLAHMRSGQRTVAIGRKWGRTAEAMEKTRFVHAHHAEAVRLVESAWRAYGQKRLTLGDSDRYRTAYVVADLLASGFEVQTVVDAMKASTSWTPGALRAAIREAVPPAPARRRPTASDNVDEALALSLSELGIVDSGLPPNVLSINRGA